MPLPSGPRTGLSKPRAMASERSRSRMVGLSLLTVDRDADGSLRKQLYTRLREAIRSGSLRVGSRLPSTRAIAASLSLSRATVADVFAQLIAENYLVTRHGSGTYVATSPAKNGSKPRESVPTSWERASLRGRFFAGGANRLEAKLPVAFQPGIPALDHFPFDIWSRLAARVMRRPDLSVVSYGDPAGYRPLREAIAAQLRSRHGIACEEEQIVVVGGSQQALDLVCRLALDPGDEVWLEDPASSSVRATFMGSGARLVPVPVDDDGIDVAAGRALAPNARLVHVTSAHQWPTCVTLSLARRAELLRWAGERDAWIVEDEYDGAFRYDGKGPAALASIDGSGRVVWIGSFSVTIFPAVRIGYLVAPSGLVDAFVAAKSVSDRQTSTLDQAVLAEFMYDGHYGRHIGRMREIYAERRDRLAAAVESSLGIAIERPTSGLHALLRLPAEVDDVAASAAASQGGVVARPLSPLYGGAARPGFVLGFAIARPAETEHAVRVLARALQASSGTIKPRLHRAAREVPG
jgi:GntR family transcriptional regulator / MocR family aminotransferase